MDKSLSPLFTKWNIGNVEIKNRIVLCPMGGTSLFGWMWPNHFSREAAAFFLERAQNNVGLIIPGIAPLKDTIGGRWLYQNKKMFRELKIFMKEIHKTGAKLFVQLTAGMGRSWAITEPLVKVHNSKILSTLLKPILDVRYQSASPSRLPSRWSEDITCRELTRKEMSDIIKAFARTALLCKEADVDGVEVHAVHEGYLLDQFTLKYTNHRTDEYGGSFENRYRYPAEIVKAIKDACGNEFPVSLRYSVISKVKDFCVGALPNESYTERGRDMQESIEAAQFLERAGYDMLNADNGTYDSWYWPHPPAYMPKNCNLADVAEIKKHVSIPVVCAGRMEMDTGSTAIQKGAIDAVGVARQFLTDGEWVTKLLEDRSDEIKPCICCHNACFNMSKYKGTANLQSVSDAAHLARCALNPRTMQSKKYFVTKAKKQKKVAIIGAGVGGMECALVLADRGHKSVIFEQSGTLGGVFVAAATPSFKENDRALLKWYEHKVRNNTSIELQFNTTIHKSDIARLQKEFDEIVIATGSKAKRIPIAGVEHTIDAVDFLLGDKTQIGNTIAIIGGGLTGCEIAYELCLLGKTPIIIEMKNDLIATRGVCLANTSFLRDYFHTNKVQVFLEASVVSVQADGITVKTKNGTVTQLACDKTIMSVGYDSTPLTCEQKGIHIVGDAHKVGNLQTVIWRAWDVAMGI